MAITAPTDTNNIRPLEGAIIRRCTAGTGGTTAGFIVADGADGVVHCDGNGAAQKKPKGIAIKTAAAGEVVPVVVYGAVMGWTGASVGVPIYPDDTTAGTPSETASTNAIAVGTTESATIVFVSPCKI